MLSSNIKQRISSTYAQHGTKNVELEARFGRKTDKGFVPGVTREVFNRIQSYFDSRAQVTITRSTDYISKELRKTVTTPVEGNPETIYIQKERLWNEEDTNYGIRYSMSGEYPINPLYFEPDIIREKTRYSYLVFKNTVRVDMTIVNMVRGVQGKSERDDKTRYEVEIELIDPQGLDSFDKAVKTILYRLLDTIVLYTNREADEMMSFVNMSLNSNKRGFIDHNSIVQARNLKLKDMVWGGLIGNDKTQYSVTHKADGERKLLVFSPSGIWLVMAPYTLNRISPDRIPTLVGTIIDGELIPLEKRLSGAPDSRLWYLAFDCLAWGGNIGVQDQPHNIRMNYVQAVADVMKNQLITVNTKTFKSFATPRHFFSTMREMFREEEVLSYKQDGFMFTPTNTPYNPHTDEHPLYRRVLTDYPDICKWKPPSQLTIDFQIRWVATEKGSLIQLYVNDRGKPVLFTGSKMFPYDNIGIHGIGITSDLPNNTIVEYAWDPESKNFAPVRVRNDKSKPNKIDIAEDVWMDIQRPLDKETLTGQSLDLMRAYHNKIKKMLYQSPIDPNVKVGPTLLDIGSGRGGDVSKWHHYSRIVAVEPNLEHIQELQRRIEINGMTDKVKILHAGGQDIEAIYQTVRDFIGDRVDVVSMMLSMSFFWQNQSMVNRLVNTITSNIKRNGQIIFLTIDGDLVEQTFEPAMDTGPAITRLDLGPATLTYNGNKVPKELYIHIEGTIVQDQTEWLVRLSDLILPLRKLGFDFRSRNRADTERFLNDYEITMTQMYTYAIVNTVDSNIQLPDITQVIPGIEVAPGLKTDPNEIRLLLNGQTLVPTIIKEKEGDYPPSPVAGLPPTEPVEEVLTHPIMTKAEEAKEIKHVEKQESIMKPSQSVFDINQLPAIPGLPSVVPSQKKESGSPGPAVIQPIPSLPILTTLPPLFPGTIATQRVVTEFELPMIPVDTYEKVIVTWYPNEKVVRIGAIGDGSCFVHAIMNAYYPPYQNNADNKFRRRFVSMLRRDLAYTLQMEHDFMPGVTFWHTAANGAFATIYEQQLLAKELGEDFGGGIDYSMEGLQKLFNSTLPLGDEIYKYISDMLGIDVYVMRLTNKDLYVHLNTAEKGLERKVVVISGNGMHYETVGIERGGLFQTLYEQTDPFILALRSLITDEGGA
jgi:hypothetical protein